MRTAIARAKSPNSPLVIHRGIDRPARWQFSLRTLLSIMLCVATLSGLWRMAPQLAVFAAGAILAVVTLWRLSQAVRRRRSCRVLAIGFILSWMTLYVVSVGPALAVTQGRPAWDPIFETIYSPLERLCQREMFYRAANWYLAYWRIPID